MIKKLLIFTCLLTGYQCFAMEDQDKPNDCIIDMKALSKQEEQLRQNRKDREFEERCRLMRQKQAQRKEQAAREKRITIKTTTVKGDGFGWSTMDIEGISIDEFMDILKEGIKENKGTKKNDSTMVGFACSDAEYGKKIQEEYGFEEFGDENSGASCKKDDPRVATLMPVCMEMIKKIHEEEKEWSNKYLY